MVLFLIFLHCLTKFSACQSIYSTHERTLHQYMPPTSKDFTCSDSLEVSSAIVLSAIHKFDCLNHKTKRAICKLCRLSVTKNYFFNVSPQTSTLLLLLRSGDVSTNPGPPQNKRKYTPKNPCSHCDKGVTARRRAISCDSCGQWTHNRCASVFSDVTYDELCNSGARFTFVCQRCSFYALPFANDTTDGNIPEIITPSNVDDEERSLDGIDNESDQFNCFLRKGLPFLHLNARSLLPKLDELNVLVTKTKAAVIGVSET